MLMLFIKQLILQAASTRGQISYFWYCANDANTGYGYIKSSKDNTNGAYKVEEFVEKPDLKTAQVYLRAG